MSPVHFELFPNSTMAACGKVLVLLADQPRAVTCASCLAALRGADEALDRLKRQIEEVREAETAAAREATAWKDIANDAAALRRRLEAQLRLVRGARGTSGLSAPVNAAQDISGWFEAPAVAANPDARHDMSWPGFGPYATCDARVERPSGRFEPCGEPAASPVHG